MSKSGTIIAVTKDNKAAIMMQSSHHVANILNEDVCLPVVVIKESALNNNISWMQNYADRCHVSLSPHGKTTMTPAIFKKQLQAGAWGISVGTCYQAKIAIDAGAKNIIIANQIIGKANMQFISELNQQTSVNLFCCVDSKENVQQLSDYFSSCQQPINILIELGVQGGRCGCRSVEEASLLADYILTLPGLSLSGIEFYEGVIHSHDETADVQKIEQFLQQVILLTQKLIAKNAFSSKTEIIMTGAGSVWYDIVCQQMQQSHLPDNIRYIIRPGCYVTHDNGIYQQSQLALKKRHTLDCPPEGDLLPALELCAFVQSLPEPGLAIIGFGKRDVAFDNGLPQAIAHYRKGKSLPLVAGQFKTVKLMDQHAMLHYTENAELNVGDILIFGTSHPCITFDKWRTLYFIDDQYNIIQSVTTYF